MSEWKRYEWNVTGLMTEYKESKELTEKVMEKKKTKYLCYR